MKKIIIALACMTTLSSVAHAEFKHSISAGYSQSQLSGNVKGSVPGVNVKYNIEDKPGQLGIISSISVNGRGVLDSQGRNTGKINRYSIMAGPSFRFKPYMNVYALFGVSGSRLKVQNSTIQNTSFSYGAGSRVDITDRIGVDFSYEQSKLKKNKVNINAGTWSIGVSYTF